MANSVDPNQILTVVLIFNFGFSELLFLILKSAIKYLQTVIALNSLATADSIAVMALKYFQKHLNSRRNVYD